MPRLQQRGRRRRGRGRGRRGCQQRVDDLQELHESLVQVDVLAAFQQVGLLLPAVAPKHDLLGPRLGGHHTHRLVETAQPRQRRVPPTATTAITATAIKASSFCSSSAYSGHGSGGGEGNGGGAFAQLRQVGAQVRQGLRPLLPYAAVKEPGKLVEQVSRGFRGCEHHLLVGRQRTLLVLLLVRRGRRRFRVAVLRGRRWQGSQRRRGCLLVRWLLLLVVLLLPPPLCLRRALLPQSCSVLLALRRRVWMVRPHVLQAIVPTPKRFARRQPRSCCWNRTGGNCCCRRVGRWKGCRCLVLCRHASTLATPKSARFWHRRRRRRC
mmetsp:Transcript_40840/g.82374  ORF Transcript_40840/g.82374 Transcript_40840/m.82374 type:complete len:323 (+) Transcript_40840:869-1837(+)